MMKKIRNFVLVVFFLLLAGFIGFRIGERRYQLPFEKKSTQADLTLFWQVWSLLERKYLDQSALDPEKMVYGAISGMVSSLGDPYTAFFSPEDNQINRENLEGEFGGVGIRLGFKEGMLAVIAPLKDTPAYRAGVKAGDLILRIKDERAEVDRETEGISLPEAVKLIRGPVGTKVTLTLLSEGEKEPREVTIVRGKITIPSITSEWFTVAGKKVAYIHLLQFSEVMYQQWDQWVAEVLKEEEQEGVGGVILDLRNNPGGFLQGAVYVASEFIPQGVIVEQEYSSGRKDVFRVNRVGRLLELPLVVLINRGSASAAEILAGAIQYYQRGKIIGEKSFGKGTVQEPEVLPGGAGLHITVSRWLLPGGESIDKKGVEPDIKVEEGEERDLILERAKEEVVKI